MKNLIVTASLMLASFAQANPQQLPNSSKVAESFSPAVHRTYSVNERVFVVITDSQGNYILTPHEETNQKKDNFITKPILIIQTSNNP